MKYEKGHYNIKWHKTGGFIIKRWTSSIIFSIITYPPHWIWFQPQDYTRRISVSTDVNRTDINYIFSNISNQIIRWGYWRNIWIHTNDRHWCTVWPPPAKNWRQNNRSDWYGRHKINRGWWTVAGNNRSVYCADYRMHWRCNMGKKEQTKIQ